MNFIKHLLSFALMTLVSTAAFAQLSGTVTVPGSYPTLAAAVTALNTSGVSAATTIEVSADETAPSGGYVIGTIAGASAINTITIKAIGAITLTAPTGTATAAVGNDAIIKLDGTDYLTIDGFTLQEAAGNTTETTLMEYGIGLFAPSTTNGVQYCTIKNCTISLTRNYTTAASSTSVNFAIYANHHPMTSLVAVAPTSAAGAHSNNTIVGNAINNVVSAIRLAGNSAFQGQNNKIGELGAGNTITNFGYGPTTGMTSPCHGIFVSAQQNCSITHNTITSLTLPYHSVNHIFGIFLGGGAPSTASYTISNNTLSLAKAGTSSGRMFVIRCEPAGSLLIDNNIVENCIIPAASTGSFDGITTFGATTDITITNNIIRSCNLFTSTSSAAAYFINLEQPAGNSATVTGNQIISNIVESTGVGALIQTTTGTTAATGATNVSNNQMINNTFVRGTTRYGMYIQGSTGGGTNTFTMNNNTVQNLSCGGAGALLYGLRFAATATTTQASMNNNIIKNLVATATGTSSATVYGIGFNSNVTTTQPWNINGNTIDSVRILTNTGTGNNLYALFTATDCVVKNVRGNKITNSYLEAPGNLYSLYTSGTTTGTVNMTDNIVRGAYWYPAANVTSTTNSVRGISVVSGVLINLHNNVVSGIYAKNSAPSSASGVPIIGIDLSAASGRNNLYHNTVLLDDVGNATNGANFSASGIRYASGVNIDSRNNIVNVNIMPGSTGNAAVLRRSAGTAGTVTTNYLTTSNNNIYNITPSATCGNCFIYGEGTATIVNGYKNNGTFNTNCEPFKQAYAPRENSSFLEDNLVAGTTANTYVPAGTSYAEGLGQVIPAVATDVNGTPRASSPDAGAVEFSGTAIISDVVAPSITYTVLPNSICTDSRSLSVDVTDASGVNTTAGTMPRLWYKKSAEANTLPATNDNTTNGWKYVEATNTTSPFTFVIDHSKLNSAVVVGDIIQYFVTAQDNSTNNNVAALTATFAIGYCPTSAALSGSAFPTTGAVNSYTILAQPTTVDATASKIAVCENSTVTFGLTAASPATGAEYQWESYDGTTWSAVAGATAITYAPTVTTASAKQYRCIISCGGTLLLTSTPITISVYQPLAGNYTINASAPASATNFTSFTSLAAVMECGITAPVTVDVVAGTGPYTEQAIFPAISGASATNKITINGNGNEMTFAGVVAAPHTLAFNGTDYVTIDNLKIVGTGTTYALCLHLWNNADNNTFTNCTFETPVGTGSALVPFSISGSATSATTAGNSGSNNTVQGCTMKNGYYGATCIGLASPMNIGNKIINNTISDPYIYGIFIGSQVGMEIKGNLIERATRTTVSTFYGINTNNNMVGTLIERNTIQNAFTGAPTSTSAFYGISFSYDGTLGNENKIINNKIYSPNGAGAQYGLSFSGADYLQVYHNTIIFDNATNTGTGVTQGISSSGTVGGMDFRNNIIYINRGGSGTKHLLYYTGATGRVSNNNALYIAPTGTNNHIGYFLADITTFASWKAANGSIWDQNSVNTDPQLIGLAMGDFKPTTALLNNIGAPVGVTADFDNVTRSTTTPDPGILEFDVSNPDASIAWNSPTGPQTVGNKTIVATLTNVGGGTITSAEVTYSDGVTTVSQTFTGLTVNSGASTNLTFTTPYSLALSVTMTVTVGDVNGTPETNIVNNTASIFLCRGLSGTYTIDKNNPSSSTNFSSFLEAATALNCGLFGPVTLNVVAGSGPYIEQVELLGNASLNATNTLTINGNGNTLTFTATSTAAPSTFVLNGADYVTINDLKIVGDGATAAFALHLWNGANNNTFNNLTLEVPTTTTGTVMSAYSVSGSATSATTSGVSGNDNVISNSTILGGYYTTSLVGSSTAGAAATGNKILNCTIKESYLYGSYSLYQISPEIKGCTFERPTRTTVSTYYGVYFSTGVVGGIVEKCTFRKPFGAAPASTSTAYMVYILSDAIAGNEHKVINNVFYDMTSSGTLAAIYLSGVDYVNVYNNSIAIEDANFTGSSLTYGIYCTGTVGGMDFKNNNILITRTGSGKKYGFYLASNSVATSNNNNIFVNSPTAAINITGYNGADRALLSDWQAVNYDLNSVSINPAYVSTSTGDLKPSAFAFDNLGTPLASVTTDFLGVTRNSSTPDIGAYEFDPPSNDVAIAWDSPVSPLTAGSKIISLNVTNTAIATVSSLLMKYSDGTNTVTETITGLNIAAGTSQVVSFTTPYNLTVSTTITATVEQVNGTVDPTPANSVVTKELCIALNGTYTIDQSSPASVTNFVSFATAVAALNCGGIGSAVTFNVVASTGPYIEQIKIGQIIGTSATNTITFNGNGNTLSSATNGGNPNVWGMNGTDFLVLNNLIIEATSASNAIACHLFNDASDNQFNNCTFRQTDLTSTNSVTSAFALSGSEASPTNAGLSGNNNVLTGCTMEGGYYCAVFAGPTAAPQTGNKMINCNIRDFYFYGAYSTYQDGALIKGCTIERPNRTTVSTFYGLYLAGSNPNGVFERNIVQKPFGAASTSTSAAYMIYCSATSGSGAELKIHNNIVRDIDMSSGSFYGIYMGSAEFMTATHNSVNCVGAGTGTAYGIYMTSALSQTAKNNLINISRAGTGTSYGAYFSSATPTLALNYNNYYINGAGTNYIGYLGAAFSTLATWKGAGGGLYDQNSVNIDPTFVSAIDLTPTNALLNDKGEASFVTEDFNGITRGAVPDIGAIEFGAASSTKLTAKVFLNNVGATGQMSSVLADITGQTPAAANFPLNDPYGAAPFTHVNNGAAQVTTSTILTANNGTGDDIVDWVFIELRTGTSGSTTVAYTQSALLQADGDIVSAVDGISAVSFPNAPTGNYYVTIRHRNHLGFRTSNLVAMSPATAPLNFTNNSVALFGATPTIAVNGYQTMVGGDANSDGIIDVTDRAIYNPQRVANGANDYRLMGDFNLDGLVNLLDLNIWRPANNNSYQQKLD